MLAARITADSTQRCRQINYVVRLRYTAVHEAEYAEAGYREAGYTEAEYTEAGFTEAGYTEAE